MSLAETGESYCPACSSLIAGDFAPGPGGRPKAACPRCGSLERHRFLALLLACVRPTLGGLRLILDVAPSRQVTPLLRELEAAQIVRFDIGSDGRQVDVVGSLTDVPLADGSVDLMVCYHVLEHIPDDRSAMREIARVLAPNGLALLQVPWRPGAKTDEDPDASPQERVARFGQADHVRYYGVEFEERLIECGLTLRRVTPRSLLGEQICQWCKLAPDETVWLATHATGSATAAIPANTVATSLTKAFDVLADELGATRRREKAAQATIASLQVKAAGERATTQVLRKRIAVLQSRDPLTRLARLAPRRIRQSKGRLASAVRRKLT